MRSFLLKGVASIFALLGVVAFSAATSAVAAEVHFSGNTAAAFAQTSPGTHSKTASTNSEFATAIESNFRYTVGDDTLSAVGRIRVRGVQDTQYGGSHTIKGSGDQPQDAYVELHWHPTPQFLIMWGKFQGQAWSQPETGSYIMEAGFVSGAAQEYWMNWTGQTGIDFDYNAGVAHVGVGISTKCRPSCDGGTAGATATAAQQTIDPHLTGTFGPIGLRLQLPQTSAKVGTESAKGSGLQLGLKYAASGVSVALDVQSFTDKALTSADNDVKMTGTGLKVSAAGASLLFHTLKTDAGGSITPKNTEIKLYYTMKVGAGEIIPAVWSTTQGATSSTDQDKKNTAIALIGNVGF